MKRGPAALARALIGELAAAGIGARETGRIMQMSPGLVAYYRKLMSIAVDAPVVPTTDEIIAKLPADTQARIHAYREARAS